MASNKKQSFLHGAALLAGATAIVKVLGALYKIPLGNIIDDAGFGYFNTAYDIYSVLLMISTAGLPVAMSRMIAEAGSLGRYGQIRRIYQTALCIFLGLGVASPTPEWGTIISENMLNIRYYPYLGLAPGICICLAVMAVNFIGDGLRDAFDPRAGR